jgi:cytochrome P450
MKEDAKAHGGLFSYEIIGGRRMTIVADPSLFWLCFEPDDYCDDARVGNAVKVEMDKLAYSWFGIPKSIAGYTRPGLDAVRSTLASRAAAYNDNICIKLIEQFKAMPADGAMDLFTLGAYTFWPVNAELFGSRIVAPDVRPDALELFMKFDHDLPAITGGMPKDMFPDHLNAAKAITEMFSTAVENNEHTSDMAGEVLRNRLAVCAEDKNLDDDAKGVFMLSIFWAAQANTLPMTFWTLAHTLGDRRVYEKAVKEALAWKPDKNGHYEVDDLPYIRSCMKEVLRQKVAVLTHRKVSRDVEVTDQNGINYKIPKGDMLSVASYIRHYDDELYPEPEKFIPERWLEEDCKSPLDSKGDDYWFPFSKGRYSCSGKFLALLEIPALVALMLQEFHAELLDPVPEANWDEVLAAVLPKDFPPKCRVKFTRREGAGAVFPENMPAAATPAVAPNSVGAGKCPFGHSKI